MRELSKKRKELIERRRQVTELLALHKTRDEIAIILGVSNSSVDRDIVYLRRDSRERIDDLATGHFSVLWLFSLERQAKRIRNLDDLTEKTPDIRLKAKIIGQATETEKFYLQSLGEGPTLHSLQRALGAGNVQAA